MIFNFFLDVPVYKFPPVPKHCFHTFLQFFILFFYTHIYFHTTCLEFDKVNCKLMSCAKSSLTEMKHQLETSTFNYLQEFIVVKYTLSDSFTVHVIPPPTPTF